LTVAATLSRVDGGDIASSGTVEATRRSAADAVSAIEREHGQALFGFARRLGLPSVEADDAVQDTLMKLYVELSRGVAILNPSAWAFRACYRVCMDHHRRSSRQRRAIERATPPAEHAPRADIGDSADLWAEVDRLPARQRQVLYLRYVVDMSFGEVAATLGITASAARSHDTQARASLRRVFEGR
jgi:RNA polymerase sigma factor (sigma-70 family)